MPEVEVVDEVVPISPKGSNSRGRDVKVFSDAVDGAGERVEVADDSDAENETVDTAGPTFGLRMKDSTRKLLDKLATHEVGDGGEGDPDDTIVDEVPAEEKPATAAPAAEATPGEEKPAEEVAEAAPSELDNIRAENARLAEANRRLVAEFDARSKVPAKAEPTTRDKLFAEGYDSYLDDSVGAVRKWLAASLGVDDPNDKSVDAELAFLYTDLTAREVGVPLEPAVDAARKAARATQLLARDKRERKAESEQQKKQPAQNAEAQADQHYSGLVRNEITAKDNKTGKSIADEFPMTMAVAESLDGMKPELLIWNVIKRETRAGNFDPTAPNDVLIRKAANLIEQHYAGIYGKFPKPPTDTANTEAPKPALPAKPANKDTRQSPVARPITNAAAGVAPATPPKPAPKTEEAPKYKNDKERREAILRKHFPD